MTSITYPTVYGLAIPTFSFATVLSDTYSFMPFTGISRDIAFAVGQVGCLGIPHDHGVLKDANFVNAYQNLETVRESSV